jgi:hypothetical protein
MSATTPIARPMAMPAVPASISGTGVTNAFARPGIMASKPTREVEDIIIFIFGNSIMYVENLCIIGGSQNSAKIMPKYFSY